MPNAFVRKLRRFAELDDADVAALVRLVSHPVERDRGSDLIHEGERPVAMQVLLQGWACRYKALPDGARQIVGLLLPGDACNPHVTLLETMDHSIGIVSDARVAAIAPQDIEKMLARHEAVTTALRCASLVDESILREWLTNASRRDAHARIGHLICELWYRLNAIGQVDEHNEFDFPLTQEQVGDALGLTPVHVNRMVKRLREDGLIDIRSRRLSVLKPAKLATISDFDPAYLHDGSDPTATRPRSRSAR